MSEKNFGKTVLGWFVVDEHANLEESSAGDGAADALIKKYSGGAPPSMPPAPPVALSGDLPKVTGGSLDFSQIYVAADVSLEEQDRVKKAQDLLASLPAETPLQVKRQIVEASLKAFGYPIRDLIEAGVAEIEALESYIQTKARDTQQAMTDASARIQKLNQDILDLRQVVTSMMDEQTIATKMCNEQKLAVQRVLEFFGVDEVAQVVKESPKLHEPPNRGPR